MTSRQRQSAIDAVAERLQIVEVRARGGAISADARQDAAARIVDAVVGITKPQPQDFFDFAAANARLQFRRES